MSTNRQIQEQISGLQKATGGDADIERKLDELIVLLQTSDIDSEKIKEYQKRFNEAVEHSTLDAFKKLDNESLSREELLNDLGKLLEENPIDSKITSNIVKKSATKRIVLALIGIALVTLGFAMIILPAPPYFEMFTVFYFSNDDGVTLMDLISLIIILCGVYLLVMSAIKHKKGI
ncbi:MAG TPA: hypothetical protein VG738_12660 [Chitinophagaceae bacterium]|nr:hypothetical protein [Chitinophagaceae bacterium]